MTNNCLNAAFSASIANFVLIASSDLGGVSPSLIVGAVIMALVGGMAAAFRDSKKADKDRAFLITKYCLNTVVLGVSLAFGLGGLVESAKLEDAPQWLKWMSVINEGTILMLVGVISLAGLMGVDFIHSLAKRWTLKKTGLENEKDDP